MFMPSAYTGMNVSLKEIFQNCKTSALFYSVWGWVLKVFVYLFNVGAEIICATTTAQIVNDEHTLSYYDDDSHKKQRNIIISAKFLL